MQWLGRSSGLRAVKRKCGVDFGAKVNGGLQQCFPRRSHSDQGFISSFILHLSQCPQITLVIRVAMYSIRRSTSPALIREAGMQKRGEA